MKKFLNKKGFTLTELMVVVVIMGILVAVAVPIYSNVTGKAAETACDATVRTIESAIVQMTAINDVLPADVDAVAFTVGSDGKLDGDITVGTKTVKLSDYVSVEVCPVKEAATYAITDGKVVHNHTT